MNMTNWAENEVKLACKEEAPDREDGEWNYGCACYESALKAFKSLTEDGHSGFSIGLTKNILNRLIDGKPLTPITEADFYIPEGKCVESEESLRARGLKSSIQCTRMSSLFRDEKLDGTVKYIDVDRAICTDINDENHLWYSCGFMEDIALKDFPITLPYYTPNYQYRIYTEEYQTSFGILYMITPELNRIEINRYFEEYEDPNTGYDFIEISKEEYEKKKHEKVEEV